MGLLSSPPPLNARVVDIARHWPKALRLLVVSAHHVWRSITSGWLCVVMQASRLTRSRSVRDGLKWLTLALLAYLGVVCMVHIDWAGAAARAAAATALGR